MAKKRNPLGSIRNEVSKQAKETLLSKIKKEDNTDYGLAVNDEIITQNEGNDKVVEISTGEEKVIEQKKETTSMAANPGTPVNTIKSGARRKKYEAVYDPIYKFNRSTNLNLSEENKRKLTVLSTLMKCKQAHLLDNIVSNFFKEYEKELKEDHVWDIINQA
jgi:hypothetical protein